MPTPPPSSSSPPPSSSSSSSSPAWPGGAPAPSSAEPATTRLAQDIVIEGASGDARVGAQAIAPDHAPRAVTSTAAPVVGRVALPASDLALEISHEISQLLYHQSELLDSKRWQDYIALFADDGMYWMPVTPEQTDWQSQPSIFAEDIAMMRVRMGRVTHPTAWSQVPMWSTNHVVGNIVVESATESTWTVRSRFHMMELRRDTVRHFGGSYRHTLVRQGGELKIQLQRVDLFNAQAPYDYVLQVWI